MALQEISLVGLSGIFAIAAPPFLHFRERMSKNADPKTYSKKQVIRFTAINIFLNSFAFFGFMLIFLSIITKPDVVFTFPLYLTSALFLLAAGITFYGCGIYMTSVIIDTLTPRDVRKTPELRKQLLATSMFHGPISHIIIFSGFIVSGALLAILDLSTGPTLDTLPRYILVSGAILGLTMGYAQITNGTAPYQTITGIICIIALFIMDKFENWKFTSSPIGIYMIGFFITFILLNLYYFNFRWKWKNLWTRSGYREYN